MFQPSSPLRALREALPDARIDYADGRDRAAAARLAREADVAIVFATQWAAESVDLADMRLPDGQDALIEAVAAANPRSVVVLQTNGPVELPWLDAVPAVLQAWYPGIRGGEAIARLLTGAVNPSGHLPVTWPVDVSQLPRPTIPGLGFKPAQKPEDTIDYDIEGANVGYRWFAARGLTPRYAFGHGLSYTRFETSGLHVRAQGEHIVARFSVRNAGERAGVAVPQLYVHLPQGHGTPLRLAGWDRVELHPGETREVEVALAPRLFADYHPDDRSWRIAAGDYTVVLGQSAVDTGEHAELTLPARRLD